MDAHDIILSFQRRGIELRANGDKLKAKAPRGVLTEDDVAALRRHKAELLALLASESSSTSATPPSWPDRYGDLDDAHYQAVVDADIARHGHYVPTRQYAEPAEDPEAIWERCGLPPVASVTPRTNATTDTAICPDCNASATRLGTFTLDDGRGRFECPRCRRVFWSLPGQVGAPRSADVSTPRHYDGPTPPCPKCGGPTHDAADHVPGIVVLLCDDGERCRWGLAMSQREFAAWLETGIVPGQPASEAS